MALDEKFAEAFVNLEQHKVLGYKLKPFSIWHRFLLEFFNSPLIGGDEKANISHILQAISICRVSYPDYPKKQSVFSKLNLLCRSWDAEKQSKNFMNYIEDYASFPDLWNGESKEGSKSSSAPETLSMTVQLIELGFSEHDSWNMAIGKAFWYTAISALLKGAEIDFVTQEEREMQANKDKILADMAEAERVMKQKIKEQKNGV